MSKPPSTRKAGRPRTGNVMLRCAVPASIKKRLGNDAGAIITAQYATTDPQAFHEGSKADFWALNPYAANAGEYQLWTSGWQSKHAGRNKQ